MELYDALLTTRAMRRYRDDPVTDDEIERCLRAAQQAPSGGNLQPWQYLVVTDPERRARVGELYKSAYDRYERTLLAMTPRFRTPEDEASWRRTAEASRHLADHFGEAPALVLFLLPMIEWMPADDEGRMDIGPLYASVYPAVQNFMLAARELGIGTALTTVVRIRHDELRALLAIPESMEVAAVVPMGRPTGSFGVARRKPVAAVTHWDAFGNKRSV
ncbi:MAG TPA: nitroreductase family protein [Ilumatobacteraceae bacterium]|jgi:nitroreductase|nr:nitroreductase family protein [Ilumatobacteraceae bacterium]